MFRDDDPGLAELRAIALGHPDAFEKVSHGRPGFFVAKMFARYGGVDWAEVRELVDASYRLTAPRRSLKLLDESPSPPVVRSEPT
jgi:hypothetical protein